MLKWLYILFIGHEHRWQTICELDFFSSWDGTRKKRYYLRCECCGNIKRMD